MSMKIGGPAVMHDVPGVPTPPGLQLKYLLADPKTTDKQIVDFIMANYRDKVDEHGQVISRGIGPVGISELKPEERDRLISVLGSSREVVQCLKQDAAVQRGLIGGLTDKQAALKDCWVNGLSQPYPLGRKVIKEALKEYLTHPTEKNRLAVVDLIVKNFPAVITAEDLQGLNPKRRVELVEVLGPEKLQIDKQRAGEPIGSALTPDQLKILDAYHALTHPPQPLEPLVGMAAPAPFLAAKERIR